MTPVVMIVFGLVMLAILLLAVSIGMACAFAAFIVFKPVITAYANSAAANLKATEKIVRPEEPTIHVRSTKEAKPVRGTVKRAVRDVEEEVV